MRRILREASRLFGVLEVHRLLLRALAGRRLILRSALACLRALSSLALGVNSLRTFDKEAAEALAAPDLSSRLVRLAVDWRRVRTSPPRR